MRALIERARAFAVKAHGDQRYGDEPYAVHLDAVADILIWRFAGERQRPHVIAAGYLHDTLEDTPVTRDELAAEFGHAVALLVDAVTDGPGKTRRERKERPYTLIPLVRGALVIKLADRIANIEAALANGRSDLLATYRNEHAEFSERLQIARQAWRLYAHLEGLIARIP